MNSVILYLIKVNALLIVFYLFYFLLVRKDTFYSLNRYFFLSVIPLVLIGPFLNLSALFSAEQVQIIKHIAPDLNLNVSGANEGFTLKHLILSGIVIGAVIFLLRIGMQLMSLRKIYKSSEKKQEKGFLLVKTKTTTGPFSFFRSIYLNPALHHENDLKAIIEHEKVHIRELHSIDIILYETLFACFWYNPVAWLLKQSVKQNIEFYTDKQVLKAGHNKKSYQHNLLKVSQVPAFLEIANNFNFNYLKNRIMMMNKKQSSSLSLLKFLLIIPLFTGMTLFASTKQDLSEISPSIPGVSAQSGDNQTIVVNNSSIHDFGTIKESAGSVSTVFTITNTGKEPLILVNVKASCGCTTPEWTKEPIAPGKQGQIKATYNPANRPGAFNKTITVSSNGSPSSLTLNIKGEVVRD